MARLLRLALGGHAHLAAQRGHDGGAIVRDDADRQSWLALLRDAAVTHRVDVHAWALLDNEFQLVATPSSPEGLSRLMQTLARRHAAAFNRRHARSGTLWDGRYRAALLQPGAWLVDAMLLVELQPARAGLMADAADWPWSSLRHHLGAQRDPGITECGAWWKLGNTPFDREAAWRRRAAEGLPPQRVARLEAAVRRGWPVGEAEFLGALQTQVDKPLSPRPRGRPARTR
jgi:putative transposase